MIITLCGSARFEADYIEANKELSLRGFVVIPLSTLPRDNEGNKDWYNNYQKEMLDLVHLSKIQSSQAIVVVGDGYIGRSTSREILWAHMNDKTIVAQVDGLKDEGTDWDRIATLLRTGTIPTKWVHGAQVTLKGQAND